MKQVQLQVTAEGGVRMLQDDAVDLREFGDVSMVRASHVEWSDKHQSWYVQSAKTGKILMRGFPTRGAALAWEKEYYSPNYGPGWDELTGE